MYEPLDEHGLQKTTSDRGFGLTVGGILVALGLFRGVFRAGFGPVTGIMLVAGVLLIATALLAAHRLAPLNRAWAKLGLLMARVINPIVIALVYIVAVVPTGCIARWLGYDPLRLKREANRDSYWIERQPPGPAPDSLRDQF